jgi:hypothetical protein
VVVIGPVEEVSHVAECKLSYCVTARWLRCVVYFRLSFPLRDNCARRMAVGLIRRSYLNGKNVP